MMKPILLVTTLAALAAASAALAQPPAASPLREQRSAPTGAANAGLDPNEMICRSEAVVGSRLQRRRTCVTRAQWAEQMRADRTLTEHAQTTRTWCERGPC